LTVHSEQSGRPTSDVPAPLHPPSTIRIARPAGRPPSPCTHEESFSEFAVEKKEAVLHTLCSVHAHSFQSGQQREGFLKIRVCEITFVAYSLCKATTIYKDLERRDDFSTDPT